MRRAILFAYMTLSLIVAISTFAHEEHKKAEKAKSENQQKTESENRSNQNALNKANETEEERAPAKPIPMPFSGSIQDHAHNKLVHLPIGLGLAGVLFAFISLKKPEMLTAVRILWLLAALGAVGAYFTGEAQEEPFEEGELHEVVELHENLGIGTGIALAVGFILSLSRRLKGLTVVWAIVVLGIIMVTGFYGGYLAHAGS